MLKWIAFDEVPMDVVVEMEGSIAAEHGIGQMRLSELARLESMASLGAKRAIKNALDPAGVLNPGRVLRPPATP